MSRLKDVIRLPMRMINLLNLGATFGLIKIQEEYLVSAKKALKYVYNKKSNFQSIIFSSLDSSSENASKDYRVSNLAMKVYSTTMYEKRKMRPCLYCDEKWNPYHTCKTLKMYLLQDNEKMKHSNGVEEEVDGIEILKKELAVTVEAKPKNSLSVVLGSSNLTTMRILRNIKDILAVILVGSSSTHNFKDPSIVQK